MIDGPERLPDVPVAGRRHRHRVDHMTRRYRGVTSRRSAGTGSNTGLTCDIDDEVRRAVVTARDDLVTDRPNGPFRLEPDV
jgi:hypothetical protein